MNRCRSTRTNHKQ